MPTELLIIGASGHAKVVIEAVKASVPNCNIRLTDQDAKKTGKKLLKTIPIELLEHWQQLPEPFHIAIGDNAIRQQLSDIASQQGKQYATIVHPQSSISESAVLAKGNFVAATAVIAAEAQIEEGCIINHGSIVDHDCFIGCYSHIAPNATLGGGVKIGPRCLIGAGAIILPQVKIGRDSVIGAGAVVTSDVGDNQVVIGVPARSTT